MFQSFNRIQISKLASVCDAWHCTNVIQRTSCCEVIRQRALLPWTIPKRETYQPRVTRAPSSQWCIQNKPSWHVQQVNIQNSIMFATDLSHTHIKKIQHWSAKAVPLFNEVTSQILLWMNTGTDMLWQFLQLICQHCYFIARWKHKQTFVHVSPHHMHDQNHSQHITLIFDC